MENLPVIRYSPSGGIGLKECILELGYRPASQMIMTLKIDIV